MKLPDIAGRAAWIFEQDDFDVDQIVGVKNIKIADLQELAGLAMTSFDPDFRQTVQPGDVLVGGANFGYGHPHYPPMQAMRHLGITAVIAESFAPVFWRGEISNGFPLIACPGIVAGVQRWDRLSVDWQGRSVTNERTGLQLPFTPLADADRTTLLHRGLIGFLKHRFNNPTETTT